MIARVAALSLACLLGAVPPLELRPCVLGGDPAQAPAVWRLAERLAEIPRESADMALSRVSGGRLLDTLIAIADPGNGRVLLFDSAGRLIRTLGKEGEGPGEFRSLSGIGLGSPETLVAWDNGLFRVTRFSLPGGQVQLVKRLDRAGFHHFLVPMVGVFADGTMVFRDGTSPFQYADRPAGPMRDTARYRFIGADGSAVGEVTAPGPEAVLMRRGRSWDDVPVLFGADTYHALGADRLVLVASDSAVVREYDSSGHLRRRLRLAGIPRPQASKAATEAARQLVLDSALSAVRTARAGLGSEAVARGVALARLNIEAVEARPSFPTLDALLLDGSGRRWLREYADPLADSTVWRAYSPGWQLLGRLRLGRRARLLDARANQVLVLELSDLDVPQVTIWRVATDE